MITAEEALNLAKRYVGEKIAEILKIIYGSINGTIFYGVCSTVPNTKTKVVSIPEITSLYTGLKVRIRFTENNAYNGTPTLKINNLDEKAINIRYSTSASLYEWEAGATLDFVYDNDQFIMVNGEHASTTFWGKTKLSSSTSSTSEDLAATPKAVKAAYDLAASNGVYYAICTTTAGTQVKTISIPEITSLSDGLHIRVLFTNSHQYNGAPMLKLNDFTAKYIEYRNTKSAVRYEWNAGAVLDLVYVTNSGDSWVIVDGDHASTFYYGRTKLSSSDAGTSESLAATEKLANTKVPKAQLIDVVTPSFSTLPSTFYSDQLTADCKVVGNAIELSEPKAGDIDWNVSFAAGSLTISGTFHGSMATTVKMSVWIPGQTITLT